MPGQPSGPYAPGGIEVPYWPTTDESRPPRGPLWFVNTVPMGLIVGIIWVSIVTYEQFTRWNPVQGLALMALLVLVIGATVAFHRARRFGMGLAFALLATPIVLAGSCFGFFASL
ncbi:MAG: hypothetical protein Q4P36_05215 [Bowdeniella nasicola]|nr:hypothetical protein [Bowdeniella nasicola]